MGWNFAIALCTFGNPLPPHPKLNASESIALAKHLSSKISTTTWARLDRSLILKSNRLVTGVYERDCTLIAGACLIGAAEGKANEAADNILKRVTSGSVLFLELSSGSGLLAFSLFQGSHLIRRFRNGAQSEPVDTGELLEEEEACLRSLAIRTSNEGGRRLYFSELRPIESGEIAESLAFAVTRRFFNETLDQYPLEDIQVTVHRIAHYPYWLSWLRKKR